MKKVLSYLRERTREPSTYAGLIGIVLGTGTLFKINEAPAIASGIEAVAGPLAAGDYIGALLTAGGIALAAKRG